MRYLQQNEIPLLPVNAIISGESVAFGAGEAGIVIQYFDRDKCLLVEWEDIVKFGVELMKIPEQQAEPEEIASPTKVE